MNAEELKARALALTNTAIAMRARAEGEHVRRFHAGSC